MSHELTFFKGRQNTEFIRVNVRDLLNLSKVTNEFGNLDPSKVSKIELIAGIVTISTDTGEITNTGDIIKIKPSTENIATLQKKTYFRLITHKDSESQEILNGYLSIAI